MPVHEGNPSSHSGPFARQKLLRHSTFDGRDRVRPSRAFTAAGTRSLKFRQPRREQGIRKPEAKRLPFAETAHFYSRFYPSSMKSVNKVILIGNVTRDGELKEITRGKSVCSFGMATNRVWKDAEGNKQFLPEYHSVVCWGGLADFAGQYVKKGKTLYIEGYLKTQIWETPEGIRKDRTEVVMENIVLLGNKDSAVAIPSEDGQ